MMKNLKQEIYNQAEKQIPDVWDRVIEQTSTNDYVGVATKKILKSRNYRRKLAMAVSVFAVVAIVLTGILYKKFIFNEGILLNKEESKYQDSNHNITSTNNTTNSVIDKNKDLVIINATQNNREIPRRVGVQVSTTINEWNKLFHTGLNISDNWIFSIVYNVDKNGNATNEMIGVYVSQSLSENKWFSIYFPIKKGTSNNSDTTDKCSYINDVDILIYSFKNASNQYYFGSFEKNDYLFSFESEGYNELELVSLLEEVL